MTRLFNLESYLECCQYAYQFEQSPKFFIPASGELPRNYKNFLQKNINSPFIKQPYSTSNLSSNLDIASQELDYCYIGTQLNDDDNKQLYIIHDTVDLFTLSTSNFLGYQESYLYHSAYHYWNHFSQFFQYKITKPLVFVNLDSFGSRQVVSLTLDSQGVPILNTQEVIQLEKEFNPIKIYDNICSAIARHLLETNFPNLASQQTAVEHLTQYLQKQFFFDLLIGDTIQPTLNLIVELLHQNKVFYKQVQISTQEIENIVIQQINIPHLRNIANRNQNYKFVLVSQYNLFSQIQSELPEFICLNPFNQDFPEIWQKKQEYEFPLFGIYLDKIEFKIGTGENSSQWIQLSDQENPISYEGQATVLTGKIPETQQQIFRISRNTPIAKLPIKVNGNDYCKNGVPQDYSIEIEKTDRTEDTNIKIEFHLQAGTFPELRVTDLSEHSQLKTYLTDRQFASYSYIPPERIAENRKQESLQQLQRFQNSKYREVLRDCLATLITTLSNLDAISIHNANLKTLQSLVGVFRDTSRQLQKNANRLELLQYLNPLELGTEVLDLQQQFSNANLQNILNFITALSNRTSNSREWKLQKSTLLNELIKFVGKTYYFSQFYMNTYLLSYLSFSQAKQAGVNLNEFFQCLTRTAITSSYQKQYFDLFENYYKAEKTQYLWGYARVLLWYYDFNSSTVLLNYKIHFIQIAQFLLTKPVSNFFGQYQQNAFLALIYLLTFRSINKEFCKLGSQEWEMSHAVIRHFQHERIILNQVSTDIPLNHLFQELIEGTATESDVEILVQA